MLRRSKDGTDGKLGNNNEEFFANEQEYQKYNETVAYDGSKRGNHLGRIIKWNGKPSSELMEEKLRCSQTIGRQHSHRRTVAGKNSMVSDANRILKQTGP